MGWISKVIGTVTGSVSPKTVDDIFDSDKGLLAKAGAWYGNRTYTSEEQAENNMKETADVRQFVKDTMDESTVRSQSRRYVAENVINFYLLWGSAALAMYPISSEWSNFILGYLASSVMAGLVLGVGAFFFGTHMLRSSNAAKK